MREQTITVTVDPPSDACKCAVTSTETGSTAWMSVNDAQNLGLDVPSNAPITLWLDSAAGHAPEQVDLTPQEAMQVYDSWVHDRPAAPGVHTVRRAIVALLEPRLRDRGLID